MVLGVKCGVSMVVSDVGKEKGWMGSSTCTVFARSVHVSVKAQKNGGLSRHPIGKLNGIPRRGL